MTPFSHSTRKLKWQIWIFALSSLLMSEMGMANPEGGQVSTSYASIPQSSLTTNNITLVSQSSIFFKPSARMDVTSLIASITPEKNLVSLTDTSVQNDATVNVHLGTVELPTGKKFTLDFFGDDLVTYAVDKKNINNNFAADEQTPNRDINQTNTEIANADTILMSAKTKQKVMDQAIFMGNMREARSVTVQNGDIILVADESPPASTGVTPNTQPVRVTSQDAVLYPEISIPNTHVSIIEALPENVSPPIKAKTSETAYRATSPVSASTDIAKTVHLSISQPTTGNIYSSTVAKEKIIDWSNILLLSMIFLGACIITAIWDRQRRLRTAQNMATLPESATMISMRQQVTEISQFAELMAQETSSEMPGPWKNYVEGITASSRNIQAVIKNIQAQGADAKSNAGSVTTLKSALNDIMQSTELMKQDPHMYSEHMRRYTETILSDAKKVLEKTDSL